MTKLAASIFVTSLADALAAAQTAKNQGADLVELRLDTFIDAQKTDPSRWEDLQRLVSLCPLPCIVTCRPTWEGGLYDGDEQTRLAVFEHAGTAAKPPALIDMELAAYQKSANLRQKAHLVVDHPGAVKPTATRLLLSSHDFQRRPADAAARLEAMANAPACGVMKLVWMEQEGDLRGNLEMLQMIRKAEKPMIGLCMGEAGLISRVLAKKFGAMLTFATLNDQTGTAPGQVSLATMKGLYRWDKLTPETKVYGVIGWPVGHSMSPPIHNAGFDAVDFNGVYLPMGITPTWEAFRDNLTALLQCEGLDFRGASVTIPHKEHLLRFVKERNDPRDAIEPLAEQIGAANTLIVKEDGGLAISNTDYAAALDAVAAGMGVAREDLAGTRVGVIGAGGAARAIVAGFANQGATVVVYNRTLDRAQTLAQEFNGKSGKVVAAKMEKLCDSCCQVLVNCTPVGMHPKVDDTPVDMQRFQPAAGTVVFDTIYNPVETRLLREAKQAGCVTIPGVEMFIRQAVGQFEGWTGQPAPVTIFRRAVLQRLRG